MGQLERRIKAAQALAGFDSVDDIAEKIGRESRGLSRKTLRRIVSETDPRTAKDYELEWIADACGVPLTFLLEGPQTAPVSTGEERLGQIEHAIAALADAIQLVGQAATQERESIMRLLQAQQQILERMEQVAAGLPTDENLQALNEAARRLEAIDRGA